jgi:hypothetical protein
MSRVEKRLRPARSRPVSCLFCRSRKLRCSRQFPCPNCTSRGIACDRDAPTATSINEAVEEESETPSGTFQQNVLSRLHRLERLVMGRGELSSPPSVQTGSQPSPPSLPRGDFFTGEKYSSVEFNWLEGAVTHPSPMVSCAQLYNYLVSKLSISRAPLCRTNLSSRHAVSDQSPLLSWYSARQYLERCPCEPSGFLSTRKQNRSWTNT